jgi:hypothetical protein
VLPALSAIRQTQPDITMCAVTNGNAHIDRTALAQYLSFCVRAEDVGCSKPNPEPYNKACELAKCTPEEVPQLSIELPRLRKHSVGGECLRCDCLRGVLPGPIRWRQPDRRRGRGAGFGDADSVDQP